MASGLARAVRRSEKPLSQIFAEFDGDNSGCVSTDELAGMLMEQETVDSEELQELLIKRDVRIAEYV